jgi:hypothetical protein
LAVLAREPMMLAVAAIALDAAIREGRPRPFRSWLRRLRPLLCPAVVLPVLAFAAWRAYVIFRFDWVTPGSGALFGPPFKGVIEASRNAAAEPPLARFWDDAYLVLMLVGIGTALWRVRSRRTAPAFAAAAFGLALLFTITPDHWSFTRYSAPMFLALFVSALEDRKVGRVVVWPAGAAVLLTALVTGTGIV